MKSSAQQFAAMLVLAGLTTSPGYMQTVPGEKSGASYLEMTVIPDGNYLVGLQIDGKNQRLNFELKNNVAQCVASEDPKLARLRGYFQAVGNGVFFVFLQNENYRASQHWVFRADGSTQVKEVPDRGEIQRAVRVNHRGLEEPKK